MIQWWLWVFWSCQTISLTRIVTLVKYQKSTRLIWRDVSQADFTSTISPWCLITWEWSGWFTLAEDDFLRYHDLDMAPWLFSKAKNGSLEHWNIASPRFPEQTGSSTGTEIWAKLGDTPVIPGVRFILWNYNSRFSGIRNLSKVWKVAVCEGSSLE